MSSIIPNSVVSGLASTSMQAQQVSRQNDSAKGSSASEMKKVRKVFDSHLMEFEEDTNQDSSAQIRIDSRMSDQDSETGGQSKQRRRHGPHPEPEDQVTLSQTAYANLDQLMPSTLAPQSSATPTASGPAGFAVKPLPLPQGPPPPPLYTHLDIQA